MKKTIICLSLCISFLLNIPIVNANDIVISNYDTVTIEADLDNVEEVHAKVQEIFKQYGSNVIVEVLDIDNLKESEFNTISSLKTGSWVTNRRSYFIGHVTYGTEGIITCFVNGNSVSQCSGEVNIFGGGITFRKKEIQNGTTRNASLYWELYVSTAILGYRTPLFD